jgi:hypothetical protein
VVPSPLIPSSNLEADFEAVAPGTCNADAAGPSHLSFPHVVLAPITEYLKRFTSAAWGTLSGAQEAQTIEKGAAPPAPDWQDVDSEVC